MFNLIVNHFLGNLPVWLWPFVAGTGFGVYFLLGVLGHFPQFKIYATVGRPIAIVVMVLGVFLYGGAGVLAIQQQALEEAKQRVAIAEQASADATQALANVLASQASATKDRSLGVKKTIQQDKTVINADCNKINDRAWADYNSAVKNGITK
jgi:hypothetical protein